MAKRKVTQDDLRKMMAQVKTKASASTGPASKKYKLSTRELALLEEQKREDERNRAKEKERKAAALAGLPKPDAVPHKSILKNKPTTVPVFRPPQPLASLTTSDTSRAVVEASSSSESRIALPPSSSQTSSTSSLIVSTSSSSSSSSSAAAAAAAKPDNEVDGDASALPEGFFDDPVADAKARNVQYVDTAEEEWARFQKEMVEEMSMAQDILVEDRIEATNDRQIEEIDEQMRAWNRVVIMEKKIEESLKPDSKSANETKSSKKTDSDEDDEDFEEFLDWRNKK